MIVLIYVAFSGYLSTKGRDLVDENGEVVRLTGLGWYGYETSKGVIHGLWYRNLHEMIEDIASRGINCLRIPIAASVIHEWIDGKPQGWDVWGDDPALNPDLVDKDNLFALNLLLADCKRLKIKIFFDIHSLIPDAYDKLNVWFDEDHPEEYILTAHEWIAKTYLDDDTVIGIDLKNEPHGGCGDDTAAKWDDSQDPTNWKRFVELAASRIHAINPNLLIIVEGIDCFDWVWGWWGGVLRPAAQFPIDLGEHQDKLVYSPHEYSPTGYDQEWFKEGLDYDSLWKNHFQPEWMFLWEDNVAPILIGEWAGDPSDADDRQWLDAMVKLINDHGLSYTYWCFNDLVSNSKWLSWDEEKFADIKATLAPVIN